MTKFLAAMSVLVLVGCGGNDFYSLFGPIPENGPDGSAGTGGARSVEHLGAGGATEADSGPAESTGGAAKSTGGSSSGGSTSNDAAPTSAGGATDCPADSKKLCAGVCLSYADVTPSVGCWEASCAPCAPPPAHAHTVCGNGRCDFECNEGYQRNANQCVAACGEVVHNDGLGQSWSDCAPLGTFTQDQAEKACAAWCVVNGGCHCAIGTFCGDSNPRIYALIPYKMSFMTWVWQGDAGNVVQADPGTAGQPACMTVSNWQ